MSTSYLSFEYNMVWMQTSLSCSCGHAMVKVFLTTSLGEMLTCILPSPLRVLEHLVKAFARWYMFLTKWSCQEGNLIQYGMSEQVVGGTPLGFGIAYESYMNIHLYYSWFSTLTSSLGKKLILSTFQLNALVLFSSPKGGLGNLLTR